MIVGLAINNCVGPTETPPVDGILRYQKTRFDKRTARQFAAGIIAVLDAATTDPARRLSELLRSP